MSDSIRSSMLQINTIMFTNIWTIIGIEPKQ